MTCPIATESNLVTLLCQDGIAQSRQGTYTDSPSPQQSNNSTSQVRAVLMLGQRRPNPGLLIELDGERDMMKEAERTEAIEQLWPAIEEGNKGYYELTRVSKDRILFTRPGKPMRRAAKGTVQRRPTLDAYTPEIEKMYGSV